MDDEQAAGPGTGTSVPPTPPASDAPEPGQPKKKFRFPTAFTVLAAVLVLVWIASFFVPAGAYDTDPQTGSPVPGPYHKLPSCQPETPRSPVLPRRREAAKELETAAPPVAAALPPGTPCADKSFPFRFKQLWDSTPNGLYGV